MSTVSTCAGCGTMVDAGARFCMQCGADVSDEQGNAATRKLMAATAQMQEALLESVRHATLGEYEVLAELGQGGMATVFLAHDIHLDRKVAIKVMNPGLVSGEGMVERFRLEARTAASLSHPNIIPIYAVKQTDDLLYFVMKFVEGRALDSIIKQVGRLPIPMARAVLVAVAEALGYAHRKGIVHRDIKPGNIMIDSEGSPVVTDFGIAKVAEKQGLTMTGATVGTPSYMSPEQCSAKEITGQSDQYSLGIVAYEMLTGRTPFDADSIVALMYKHCHDLPEEFQVERADCPSELHGAVMRMLAKKPEDRWPSMDALVTAMGTAALGFDNPVRTQMIDLAKAGENLKIVRRVSTPSSPMPSVLRPMGETVKIASGAPTEVAKGPRRSRRGLMVGGVVAVVAVAAGALLWLGGGVDGTSPEGAAAPADAAQPVSPTTGAAAEPPAGPPPVVTVEVQPADHTLQIGASVRLSLAALDGDGRVVAGQSAVWSSSDPGVATVSSEGMVRAVAAGIAMVEASVAGVTGLATVRVPAPPGTGQPVRAAVATVRVSPAADSLVVGARATARAVATDAAGNALDRAIRWRSSNTAVVQVDAAGAVSAVGVGSAVVSAIADGVQGGAAFTVVPEPVAAVSVTPAAGTLEVGGTLALAARVTGARGTALPDRPVSWSSSNPRVAAVDAGGVVSAVAPGQVTVVVEVEGRRASVPVTVTPPVVSAPVKSDRELVTEIIRAYEQALEARDIEAVRDVYPSIPRDLEDGLQQLFRSMRDLEVTLNVSSVAIDGERAQADVDVHWAWFDTGLSRDQELKQRVRYVLRKSARGWRLVETQ